MNIITEARKSYEYLNSLYNYIVKNNLWEYCEQYALSVNKHINNLKKLPGINPKGDMGASTWFASIEKFEKFYYKILYYKDLWASSDWILDVLDEIALGKMHKISEVNNFIKALLSDEFILLYKKEIARIIRGTISQKMLYNIYLSVRRKTDGFTYINEGFYNPFNDEDMVVSQKTTIDVKPDNDRIIKSIKIYNNANKIGGLIYKNGRVFANKTFYVDDIIEIAPVRILQNADLYSSSVRQITFPIDTARGIFGVPFGIGSIARNEMETGISGNIDYEYDPSIGNEIKIYATKTIKRGEELIFVDDNKFENIISFDKYKGSTPDKIVSISAI